MKKWKRETPFLVIDKAHLLYPADNQVFKVYWLWWKKQTRKSWVICDVVSPAIFPELFKKL